MPHIGLERKISDELSRFVCFFSEGPLMVVFPYFLHSQGPMGTSSIFPLKAPSAFCQEMNLWKETLSPAYFFFCF